MMLLLPGWNKFSSCFCCLINSNAFSNRWTYCHSREYVFYWWKEEKIINSRVGEGARLGKNRMENTNGIFNGTAIRNMKLVKCKGTRQITQEKSHAVEVFASSPALLATVSSVILGDWNNLANENSKITDVLQGSKWLCRLSWNQAGLATAQICPQLTRAGPLLSHQPASTSLGTVLV